MATYYTTSTSEIMSDAKVLEYYQNRPRREDEYDVSAYLFNSPFHLLESADPCINSKIGLGRKFMECIASNASIVHFIPGTADYLPGHGSDQKDALLDVLGNAGNADDSDIPISDIVANITGKDGQKFFDFKTTYSDYISYVNCSCRMLAVYLGIGNCKGPNGKDNLDRYNWHNYQFEATYPDNSKEGKIFGKEKTEDQGDVLNALFGNWNFVRFYCDSNTTATHSMSNSTTESKLKSVLDSGSDMMKELQFLTSSGGVSSSNDSAFTWASDQIKKLFDGFNSESALMTRLSEASTTTLQGNNLLFPELWSSSDNNYSYTLSFNLISPYGDVLSRYYNVLVPMIHLLCLTAPRQIKGSANSYGAPFLIKAFSRGWFCCNMGIVDSLNITRGEDYAVDGLPTSLKIDMSIRDLYSDLMISKSTRPGDFFINQSLMNFLAVNAGVDVTKPFLLTQIDAMMTTFSNGYFFDLPDQAYQGFIDQVRNVTDKLWKGLSGM